MTEGDIQETKQVILIKAINVTPKVPLPSISNDEDDNNILQLSDHVKAEYLITGDKGLLALEDFGNTKIVSPRDFYNRFILQE